MTQVPYMVMRRGLATKPRLWRWLACLLTFCTILLLSALTSATMAQAAELSTPKLVGPIGRTSTTIGVRFYRSAESNGACRLDIGYEFKGGGYAEWHDAGTFPHAPCDDPDPGYKFSGLTPATMYRLSIRAYRTVHGVKKDYSGASTITASTLAETAPVTPESTRGTTESAIPTPTPSGSLAGIWILAACGLLVLLLVAWWARRRSRR
jgi:hypothetical protein